MIERSHPLPQGALPTASIDANRYVLCVGRIINIMGGPDLADTEHVSSEACCCHSRQRTNLPTKS